MSAILKSIPKVTDDYCARVIDKMRVLHRQGNKWLNAKQISDSVGTLGSTHVQAALYRIAAMGFLNMRDGDGKDKFEYQLREEYRR